MLKIEGLRLPLDGGEDALRAQVLRLLRISDNDLLSLTLTRRSLDAREDVHFVVSAVAEVREEASVLRRCRDRRVRRAEAEAPYALPAPAPAPAVRPVVVGAGPAGLFAALVLARAGACPILIEQGKCVEDRARDVERFRECGELDPRSNVQFGEGGAGAFSDGKLNTGTRDPRHRFILEQLVSCGAPPDILIDAKPHVGTDYLRLVLRNMRKELLSLGAEIRFETRLTDLHEENGRLRAITVETPNGSETLPCQALILAPGHSARDLFFLLRDRGVSMEAKPFAVGVRIEHRQSDCDTAQYREYASHPGLPASSYKLSCHLPSGRGVFSFCVCPGGEVIAAASEQKQVVTNGMSEYARDKENINGALLVGVAPEDFGGDADPLAGIAFQRKLERDAYALGGGDFTAPVQRVEDFLARRPSVGAGRVIPTYRPAVRFANLWDCLPDFIAESIAEALPILGKKLAGYDAPDAVLTAVESRSSAPVRIVRSADGQSSLFGLYPCGEGAGYAGGILSAAADGMRCAESVLRSLRENG